MEKFFTTPSTLYWYQYWPLSGSLRIEQHSVGSGIRWITRPALSRRFHTAPNPCQNAFDMTTFRSMNGDM